jgi:hypothetical protein
MKSGKLNCHVVSLLLFPKGYGAFALTLVVNSIWFLNLLLPSFFLLELCRMLNADFLDWLDVYVRKARKAPLEPFGGIQLICVGGKNLKCL